VTINLKTQLKLIAAIILLVGLGSAVLIYLTAENDSENILANENSKMFIHDLELYGGKANVLANEFKVWFEKLWHGKQLAFTVAFITIFIAFGFIFFSSHLPADQKSETRDEDNRV
jgi:hypothetical protein